MAGLANKSRAVWSLMCLDLPFTDDASEVEDNELQVRKRTRAKPETTQSPARNTLMGLPAELRMIIYQFALQDIVDSVVDDSISADRHPAIRHSIPRLGGLALPVVSRTIRKESLDAYGPLIKAHHESLWEHYIGLQDMAWQLSLPGRYQDLDAEFGAYLR
ncbi:hypothetical protein Q7P35_001093 [Cladosporium inversicolor]